MLVLPTGLAENPASPARFRGQVSSRPLGSLVAESIDSLYDQPGWMTLVTSSLSPWPADSRPGPGKARSRCGRPPARKIGDLSPTDPSLDANLSRYPGFRLSQRP
jgi:hypothetical protein